MKKYFNNKNFSKNEENFQENLLAETKSHLLMNHIKHMITIMIHINLLIIQINQ